jgi:hypothetical protein
MVVAGPLATYALLKLFKGRSKKEKQGGKGIKNYIYKPVLGLLYPTNCHSGIEL